MSHARETKITLVLNLFLKQIDFPLAFSLMPSSQRVMRSNGRENTVLFLAAWRWRLKWKDAGSKRHDHAWEGGWEEKKEMGGKMRTWPGSKRESIGASSTQVTYIHLRFSPSFLTPLSLPSVAPFPRSRTRIPPCISANLSLWAVEYVD